MYSFISLSALRELNVSGFLPELESEYSECISAISSARREAGVLGQTSEWRGD